MTRKFLRTLASFFILFLLSLQIASCASIQNPVNNNQLASVEAGYGIALAAAVAYRNLPLCRTGTTESFSNVCARRSAVVKIQAAGARTQAAIVAARRFVRNNPTLSAYTVIQAAQSALVDFQTTESLYGVR